MKIVGFHGGEIHLPEDVSGQASAVTGQQHWSWEYSPLALHRGIRAQLPLGSYTGKRRSYTGTRAIYLVTL